MRVRVSYPVMVTDEQRQAIAAYNDDCSYRGRMAGRSECADFFTSLGYDNGLGVLAEQEWSFDS